MPDETEAPSEEALSQRAFQLSGGGRKWHLIKKVTLSHILDEQYHSFCGIIFYSVEGSLTLARLPNRMICSRCRRLEAQAQPQAQP